MPVDTLLVIWQYKPCYIEMTWPFKAQITHYCSLIMNDCCALCTHHKTKYT